MKSYFTLGFDLGGTKLAGAIVDERGTILEFRKESILELKKDPRRGPLRIVELMGDMAVDFRDRVPRAFSRGHFLGTGLASAGPLNVDSGKLLRPVNFPGWGTVPIRDLLAAELIRRGLKRPVFFQNDAISAALAEGWVGAARGLSTYAVVTIGTGIGSGVIFRNQPLQSRGMGSEFGHVIANVPAIKAGEDLHKFTVEGISSGTGLLRRAREMGFQGSDIESLVEALKNGESIYQPLFDDAADALAGLCHDLSVGLHPEKILFSGGLIKIRALYWKRMTRRYREFIEAFNPAFRCPLVLAETRNHAGVIGAASLPFRQAPPGKGSSNE